MIIEPFNSKAFLRVIAIFRQHGAKIQLNSILEVKLQTQASSRINRRILYREDPFYAIFDRLSHPEWIKFLENQHDLSQIVFWINRYLWRSKNLNEKKTWKLRQGLLLRRVILIWAFFGKCDLEFIESTFKKESSRLPSGWSLPNSIRFFTVTDENWSNFFYSANRFWSDKPWHDVSFDQEASKRNYEYEGETHYLSKVRWGRFKDYRELNQNLKCHLEQKTLAQRILKRLYVSQSIHPQDQVQEFVLTVMICYGMDLDKVLDLSFESTDSGPGWVSENGIYLNLGNQNYDDASKIFEPSIIHLPLNEISRSYSALILRSRTDEKRIVDLIPQFSLSDLSCFLGSRFELYFPRSRFERVLFELSELYWGLGIIEEQFPVADLSIIKGTPIGHHRGICSYIGISQTRIYEIQQKIEKIIFEFAGITYHRASLVSECARLHGSTYYFWKENIQKLGKQIEAAKSLNELNYLWICFLRILGFRYGDSHLHPQAVIYDYPFACFVFRDKGISARRPMRLIPFENLAKIFQTFGGFDPELHIGYKQDNDYVLWEDLREKDKIFLKSLFYQEEDSDHHLRRSIINFFKELGLGEVPLGSISGHAKGELQLGGTNSLVAPRHHWEQINLQTQQMINDLGLEVIVKRLLERSLEYGGFKSIHKPLSIEKTSREQQGGDASKQDFGVLLPLKNQDKLFRIFESNFAAVERIHPGVELAVYLSLRFQIPLDYWIDFKKYMTFNSFLKTEKELYLRLAIPQNDAGGIGTLPLRLGSFSSPFVLKVEEILQRLKSRAIKLSKGKSVLSWSIFFENKISQNLFQDCILRAIHRDNPNYKTTGNKLFRAINHVLKFRLFIDYPGVLAGAITGRSAFQLNDASLADIISLMNGAPSSIKNLENTPYKNELYLPPYAEWLKLDFSKSIRNLPKSACKEDVFDFVKKHGRGISHNTMSEALYCFSFCKNKMMLARRSATEFIKRLRKEGYGVQTKSFPILFLSEIEILIEGVLDKISKDNLSDEIKRGLSIYFLLGFCSGARIGEIARLIWQDLKIHRDSYQLKIGEGKSISARRTVDLGFFESNQNYLRKLLALFPEYSKRLGPIWDSNQLSRNKARKFIKRSGRINKTNEEAVSRKISQYIKEVAKEQLRREPEHFSFHTLRHLYAFYGTQEILEKHYWTGNYYSVMATFAAQMGHASFIFTQSSYVGTACLALQIPKISSSIKEPIECSEEIRSNSS